MSITVILEGLPPKTFRTRKEADAYTLKEYRKRVKFSGICSFKDASERARRNGRVEYALANMGGSYSS